MKKSELQGNLAMTVTLISGAMLFITLFMGYAVYRSSATFWPPLGVDTLPLTWPVISTFIIFLSSWTCFQVRAHAQKSDFSLAKIYSIITLALGLSFIVSQFFLWNSLKLSGVFADTGVFGSILYGFTWIHAAHVALGLIGLIYMTWILRASAVDSKVLMRVKNVEKFWHFLGLIWFFMFLGLFVF
jgi:cytochrome c oxidase subunit III